MRTLFLAASAAALLAGPALAQQPTSPQQQQQQQTQATEQASQKTQHFVEKAALSDQFEIQSSQLAQEKQTSDAVGQFARRMIEDHTRSSQQLQQIAQQIGVSPPQELDQEHQRRLETLRGLSGQEFSQRYVQQQVEAHENALQLYRQYAETGDNQQLQQFARQGVPSLEEHLRMAEQLEQGMPLTGAAEEPAGGPGASDRSWGGLNAPQTAPQPGGEQAR